MAGRIDQIEDVFLPILRAIGEAHGLGLDRDAALALEFHGVEHLLRHVPLRHHARFLKQPIRQRALAVVDVCDDAKIADCRLIFCHNILLPIDPYIAYRIPNIA